MACELLVGARGIQFPDQGSDLGSPALGVQSLSHWPIRLNPCMKFSNISIPYLACVHIYKIIVKVVFCVHDVTRTLPPWKLSVVPHYGTDCLPLFHHFSESIFLTFPLYEVYIYLGNLYYYQPVNLTHNYLNHNILDSLRNIFYNYYQQQHIPLPHPLSLFHSVLPASFFPLPLSLLPLFLLSFLSFFLPSLFIICHGLMFQTQVCSM